MQKIVSFFVLPHVGKASSCQPLSMVGMKMDVIAWLPPSIIHAACDETLHENADYILLVVSAMDTLLRQITNSSKTQFLVGLIFHLLH